MYEEKPRVIFSLIKNILLKTGRRITIELLGVMI